MAAASADHVVLIPAAGQGLRMGCGLPKQYLELAGAALISHTLHALERCARVAELAVVIAPSDPHWPPLGLDCRKPLRVLRTGGATRARSVLAGLEGLLAHHPADTPVLVHDAVRPLVTAADIDALCAQPLDAAGATLGAAVVDATRRGRRDGHEVRSAGSVPRADLWLTFTPQRARLDVLAGALRAALAAGLEPGDEMAALEHAGHRPRLVQGRRDNLKITYPADLELAGTLLAARGR